MTELVPQSTQPQTFLPRPDEYRQVTDLATRLAGTSFVPKAFRNDPPAVLATMLTAREVGIGPMAGLRSIHVIEGKPTLSAELLMALVLRAGHDLYVAESTRDRCEVRFRRTEWPPDRPDGVVVWTVEDAEDAGLAAKDNWTKYRRAMLRSRAVSEAARQGFPDVVEGMGYTAEEMGADDDEVAVASMSPDETDLAQAATAEEELEVRRALYDRARSAFGSLKAADEELAGNAWKGATAGLGRNAFRDGDLAILTSRVEELERQAEERGVIDVDPVEDDDEPDDGTPAEPDPDDDDPSPGSRKPETETPSEGAESAPESAPDASDRTGEDGSPSDPEGSSDPFEGLDTDPEAELEAAVTATRDPGGRQGETAAILAEAAIARDEPVELDDVPDPTADEKAYAAWLAAAEQAYRDLNVSQVSALIRHGHVDLDDGRRLVIPGGDTGLRLVARLEEHTPGPFRRTVRGALESAGWTATETEDATSPAEEPASAQETPSGGSEGSMPAEPSAPETASQRVEPDPLPQGDDLEARRRLLKRWKAAHRELSAVDEAKARLCHSARMSAGVGADDAWATKPIETLRELVTQVERVRSSAIPF